jgi:PAS domain S-box-containing protein
LHATSPEDPEPRPLPHKRARRAVEARRGVRTLITRYFFGNSALTAAITALMFCVLPEGLPAERRVWVVASFASMSALSLACMRVHREHAELAMLAVMATAMLVIALSGHWLGWGLAFPGYAFFALFVCLLCAAASRRTGMALAAFAVFTLLAADYAARQYPAANWPIADVRLLSHLMLIGVGLAGGILISYIVSRYVRSADDREERFRSLLAIAADAYWEIDQDYRLVAASNQRDESRGLSLEGGLGCVPWDLPQFGAEAQTLEALRADLNARTPFRHHLMHWQGQDGAVSWYSLSGEPRFDERGIFTGYWGVARDVTDEITARRALAVTETRYQELFTRSPTPLLLHRDARVIDANAAAMAMFGYTDLAEMFGSDLLSAYESGDSRERERRRFEELDRLEPGTALPVADFRLLPRSGRRVAVRGTAVRVDAAGGAATLAIYIDDTERRAAEEAVRRSEALLSHLVATSPDVITLTEMETGRYSMVNETFTRLTGWSAAEVNGRTSAELGIWAHADDRQRFVSHITERGAVSDMPAEFVIKDGRRVSLLISGARFMMDRRDYLVINARDVTAAESSRLEREAILENASIGIAVTRERQFVLANPCFEQMYGWPTGGLLGKPGAVVWPDAAIYAEVGHSAGPALARGEQVELERLALRRDGSTFVCRLLAKAIDPTHPSRGGTIWITEDVTQRRQTEQALAAARDAAEAANRAKSSFLANTSHELRTPLNGMLHLAHMAREPGVASERRDLYLEQIADSAQSLADIISDILDLSKIEAGKLEFASAPFDLGGLLQAMQRAYATLAEARDLQLELDIGPGVAGTVTGDALRVRQVLSNYLSNALKFTAHGCVRLLARRTAGDQVRFEVHDQGPGIALDTQQRLFRPFTQADESTTRRFGGTGLGLSICRELATLMGGTVGVQSEPGQGSLFWAELPLPARAASAAAAFPAAAESGSLKGRRVLMVEDNAVNMLIAVALLERWDVVVEQAGDGSQALAAVQRAANIGQPFDAVLMDVQMPLMSGYEATRALRRAGARLPVIALTAAALVSEREAAMVAGMDDFLTKPIDADKLRETLTRWVARG